MDNNKEIFNSINESLLKIYENYDIEDDLDKLQDRIHAVITKCESMAKKYPNYEKGLNGLADYFRLDIFNTFLKK